MKNHKLVSRVLSAVLVLSAASFQHAASAQGPAPVSANEADADARFRRGLQLYKDGDFPQALIEFRRAYAAAPNYRVLFNIGQVCFELGEYAEALRAFEKYLAEGGAEVPQEKKDAVKIDIEKLRVRVGRIEVVTKLVGAEVSVDDALMGKTPLAELLLVTAGRRRVTISHEGRTFTRVVEVAGGEVAKIEVDFGAAAPTVQPTSTPTTTATGTEGPVTPPSSTTVVFLPWILTGTLAVAAGITGGLALSASAELKKKRETLGTTQEERNTASNNVKTLALVTDIFGAAAVVGLGISIIVTATSNKGAQPKDAPPKTAVRLGVHPTGFLVTGSF